MFRKEDYNTPEHWQWVHYPRLMTQWFKANTAIVSEVAGEKIDVGRVLRGIGFIYIQDDTNCFSTPRMRYQAGLAVNLQHLADNRLSILDRMEWEIGERGFALPMRRALRAPFEHISRNEWSDEVSLNNAWEVWFPVRDRAVDLVYKKYREDYRYSQEVSQIINELYTKAMQP